MVRPSLICAFYIFGYMKLYIHITVYGYSWIALLPLMQEAQLGKCFAGRSIKAGNRTTSKPRRQSEEMKKLATNDAETRSVDVVSANVDHLKDLFPEAFTEECLRGRRRQNKPRGGPRAARAGEHPEPVSTAVWTEFTHEPTQAASAEDSRWSLGCQYPLR